MATRTDKTGLKALLRQTPAQLDQGLGELAEAMAQDMKDSMGTSPDGREYLRPQGGVHIASQPGYPPNPDTESLKNSIEAVHVATGHYRIQDGVEHGWFLEVGTINMDWRPWMTPVFEKLGLPVMVSHVAEWLDA